MNYSEKSWDIESQLENLDESWTVVSASSAQHAGFASSVVSGVSERTTQSLKELEGWSLCSDCEFESNSCCSQFSDLLTHRVRQEQTNYALSEDSPTSSASLEQARLDLFGKLSSSDSNGYDESMKDGLSRLIEMCLARGNSAHSEQDGCHICKSTIQNPVLLGSGDIVHTSSAYVEDHRIPGRRFRNNRYVMWAGKSITRKCLRNCCNTSKDELVVMRPKVDVITAIDECLFSLHPPPTIRNNISLSKHKRWDFEEVLSQYCVGVPTSKINYQGNEEVTYEVPIIGEVASAQTKQVLDSQHERYRLLRSVFEVVHRGDPFRVRLLGEYPEGPPSEEFEELRFRLRVTRGVSSNSVNVSQAKCRNGKYDAYFNPGFDERAMLEANFDLPVNVCAVSTAARRPTLTQFPDKQWFDLYYPKRSQWKGPSYKTFDTRYNSQHDELFYPQYVLQYRPSHNSAWFTLGTFKGPQSNFEERLQMLNTAENTNAYNGVRCVALRWIVPAFGLASAEKRGLRVSVFGNTGSNVDNAILKSGYDKATLGDQNPNKSTVCYTVVKKSENQFKPKKKSTGRSWDKEGLMLAKRTRQGLKQEVRDGLREYKHFGPI